MKTDYIGDLQDRISDFVGKVLLEDTVEHVLQKELSDEDFKKVLRYADKVTLTHTPASRSQALRWVFDWKDTSEGYAYWERLHDQLWVKDKMQKRINKARKGILICSIIIFLACMYKLITL